MDVFCYHTTVILYIMYSYNDIIVLTRIVYSLFIFADSTATAAAGEDIEVVPDGIFQQNPPPTDASGEPLRLMLNDFETTVQCTVPLKKVRTVLPDLPIDLQEMMNETIDAGLKQTSYQIIMHNKRAETYLPPQAFILSRGEDGNNFIIDNVFITCFDKRTYSADFKLAFLLTTKGPSPKPLYHDQITPFHDQVVIDTIFFIDIDRKQPFHLLQYMNRPNILLKASLLERSNEKPETIVVAIDDSEDEEICLDEHSIGESENLKKALDDTDEDFEEERSSTPEKKNKNKRSAEGSSFTKTRKGMKVQDDDDDLADFEEEEEERTTSVQKKKKKPVTESKKRKKSPVDDSSDSKSDLPNMTPVRVKRKDEATSIVSKKMLKTPLYRCAKPLKTYRKGTVVKNVSINYICNTTSKLNAHTFRDKVREAKKKSMITFTLPERLKLFDDDDILEKELSKEVVDVCVLSLFGVLDLPMMSQVIPKKKKLVKKFGLIQTVIGEKTERAPYDHSTILTLDYLITNFRSIFTPAKDVTPLNSMTDVDKFFNYQLSKYVDKQIQYNVRDMLTNSIEYRAVHPCNYNDDENSIGSPKNPLKLDKSVIENLLNMVVESELYIHCTVVSLTEIFLAAFDVLKKYKDTLLDNIPTATNTKYSLGRKAQVVLPSPQTLTNARLLER